MTVRCGICGEEFDGEDVLAGHEHATNDEVPPLPCQLCGETFGTEEDLVRHQSDDHVGADVPDEEQAVP
jgi:hypothetical protein